MRPPIDFVFGNCLLSGQAGDAWALFAVEMHGYECMPAAQKRERLLSMTAALEAAEADLQLLRVSCAEPDRTPAGLIAPNHRAAADRYLRAERSQLASGRRSRLFIAVRLREPDRDFSGALSQTLLFAAGAAGERDDGSSFAGGSFGRLRTAGRALLGGLGRSALSARELERLRERSDRAHARLAAYLPLRPARGVEVQWLVRRSFCRALGEPPVDGLHQPRALAFECNGQARLLPLEGDVMRWCESYIEHRVRLLRVESELGESWQAQLLLGALPEIARFPSRRLELMFAAPESLPFGIDMALCARYLPNELALRMARRGLQDADQVLSAEGDGEQGESDRGYERTQLARNLLAYLQSAARPALLRASIAVAVSATSERQLEQRVELCRRAFGEVRLHRPPGDQLALFLQHLPGQRTRVRGYDDTLTCEQVAAMMPAATHLAGSARGFRLGNVLSGAAQSLRLSLREGSDSDRNCAILSIGALGSGKTTLAQKLKYEAFLTGARIVDCDPKGDHTFHLLPDVRPHTECLALRPEPALRGLLDPLRIAPAHLRQEAAVSLLAALLPAGGEPAWEIALLEAVESVLVRARVPTCQEVLRALESGGEEAQQVARALAVHARSGLAQLAFADAQAPPPALGQRQVTYITIRDLPGAEPGVARSEHSHSERIGGQLVRLIAMLAMHLMGAERERLKVFGFDEGWRLLSDAGGRALLGSLQRMGRSELAVPIISTQLVNDTLVGQRESLQDLIGATFVFGLRSEAEITRALALLGLDQGDRRLRALLAGFDAGRCLFRDHRGRVEAIQVQLLLPQLLRAFSTTPPGARDGG